MIQYVRGRGHRHRPAAVLLSSLCMAVIAMGYCLTAGATVPRTIHYQGKLTEPDGSPLVGEHTVTLRLYDAATAGTKLWEEQHTITLDRTDNGIFSVTLGSQTPFGTAVTFNSPLWLTTEVDGSGEFAPRQPLSAVGYAINADLLDGLDSTQLLAASGGGDITGVIAGDGLTGGAATGDATLNVGAGAGIVVASDAVSVDVGTTAGKIVQLNAVGALPAVSGANLTALNASNVSSGTVPDARLSANVSLLGPTIDSAEVTDGTLTAADTADTFLVAGSGVTVAKGTDSWTVSATGGGGTISSVVAGAGLTGGGTNGTVTLDVGAGTGLVAAADAVSVDVGTTAGKIVQLDAAGALPAVSGANLTALNAANLASGTVPDARLSSNVSLLGSTIESSEITDGTVTAADTSATFLAAGSGVTVTKGPASWTVSASGSGGDITGVAAGTGLSGGGTSGDVTLSLATPVSLANGGTGASTAAGARSALGAATSGANTDITGLSGLTTPLSVSQGGTGATTAGAARTGLGAAASGANSDITALSGLTTPLSVAQGGTGSTTASGARTNLEAAASGANSDITSLAGLTTPLSVGQGGTGTSILVAGGLLIGQGSAALTTTGVLAKGTLIVGDGVTDPALLPAGSNRAILMTDASQVSGLKWVTGCLPIGGTDSTGRSSTFQMGVFGASDTNNRFDRLWPAPVSGTVTSVQAFVNQAPGAGASWTVRFRKNAANAALSCTISAAATSCTASGTESVGAGDRLGVEFTEGGSASSTLGSGWSACLSPG